MSDKVSVPETLLKKRRSQIENKEEAEKRRALQRVANRKKRKVIFLRAEKYLKEYKQQEKSLITFRRQARQTGNFYVEAEPKVALVIRIKGIIGLHPKPRKILQILRLRQINNATFVKLNKATLNMLKVIEPYVTYGYPNLKTVRELIYKRGYGKVGGSRIALTDNNIIERALGGKDILCIEDLIHEIYTVGPHFKEANNFLWPFKLNNPNGGWTKKTTHFLDGGDAGNRDHFINNLVRRMN
eukprot:TRINITY_DN5624_c2_g1_i1.p1 TRINITY_DN5624_c2_g1~~TRINITY_DN5624_c2_g1_i1.p1  ORF type:complete len:242 (-),score=33.84 TRINITY_DN5624_c2_g1_i1:134-859(-)